MGKKIQCIGRYTMDGVTLGKGNFAHVELATHTITEVKVAIKIIDTRKIKEEYVRTNLHREARIMASLRHPNIIRLYETLKATTLYCLVTEYASGGELLAYIKSQKDCRLGESASRPFIRQLLSAIHYLHERGVVHRDLKMENIMLNEKQKIIKLIDFGLSNIYKDDELLKTHCGSPEYAAPELFDGSKAYGPEIDIWSFGIIMYAMVLGRLPFCTPFKDEYHRQRMLQQIHKGLSPVHDREMQTLTPDCRNLLHQLIEPNPQLRIPIGEVMCHPWITKNGKCPFVPYTPPPKNKMLRNQIVSALAIMMDMKKGVVNETVKENRADELSAMFNMMMDNRKRIMGLCDYDHTKPPRHDRSRSSRSRSGDREKSQTPESGCRSRHPLQPGGRKPAVGAGAGAGKKAGAGSKVKPKNKPLPKNATTAKNPAVAGRATTPVAPRSSTALAASDSTTLLPEAGSRPHQQSLQSGTTAIHSIAAASNVIQSLAATGIHPGVRVPNRRIAGPGVPGLAGSMAAALGALSGLPAAAAAAAAAGVGVPSAANGPTRIPLSQRRDPPPKLSMTLDLSVVNPRITTKPGSDRVSGTGTPTSTIIKRRDAVVPDSSFGIAASSGVPPRLSPKDGTKEGSRIPVPNTSTAAKNSNPTTVPTASNSSSSPANSTAGIAATASSTVNPTPLVGTSRARRPSSLQYSLKSTGPRLAPPPATPPDMEDEEADDEVQRRRKQQNEHRAEKVAVMAEVSAGMTTGTRRASGSAGWTGAIGSKAATVRIVAPKATPEDSIIDSCSTADEDDDDGPEYRFLGTFVDASATVRSACATSMTGTTTSKGGDQLKAGAANFDLLNFDRSSTAAAGSAPVSASASTARRRLSSLGDDDSVAGDEDEDYDEDQSQSGGDDDDDTDDSHHEYDEEGAELCRDEVPQPPSTLDATRRMRQQRRRRLRPSRSVSPPDPFRLVDVLAARAVVAAGGSCDPAGFPLRRHHVRWSQPEKVNGDSPLSGMAVVTEAAISDRLPTSAKVLPGCLPLGVSVGTVSSDGGLFSTATLPRRPMTVVLRPAVENPLVGGASADGSSDTEATLTPAASNHSNLSTASSATLTSSRQRLPQTDSRTCRLIESAPSGSGLSPGSPSYDSRHARFFHLGSHALDVFCSPDANDDNDSDDDEVGTTSAACRLSPSPKKLSSAAALNRPSTGASATFGEAFWRPVVVARTPSTRPSSLGAADPVASISDSNGGGQSSASVCQTTGAVAPLVGLIEGFSDVEDDELHNIDEVNTTAVVKMLPESTASYVDSPSSPADVESDRTNNAYCVTSITDNLRTQTLPVSSVAQPSSAMTSSTTTTTSSTVAATSSANTATFTASVYERPCPSQSVPQPAPCSSNRRVSADETNGCRRGSAAAAGGCGGGIDGGSTWLMLPADASSTSIHREGHSPCTSVVWPAEALTRTRMKMSSPVSSSSSIASITQLGEVDGSPDKLVTGNGGSGSVIIAGTTAISAVVVPSSRHQMSSVSTVTHGSSGKDIKLESTAIADSSRAVRPATKQNACNATTAAAPLPPQLPPSDSSRIPRLTSTLRRRIPVLSSLLDRKGSSSGDSSITDVQNHPSPIRKEDKRVLKSSHDVTSSPTSSSAPTTTVTATNATLPNKVPSSWRRGLTHWLQMSRASSAAAAAAAAAATDTSSCSSTNNNVDSCASSTLHRRSSSRRRRQNNISASTNSATGGYVMKVSAPMTISLVTNHGLVRTATGVVIPNNVIVTAVAAGKLNRDDNKNDSCNVSRNDVGILASTEAASTQIMMNSSTSVKQNASSGSDILLLAADASSVGTIHRLSSVTSGQSSSNKLSAVHSQVRSLLDVLDAPSGTAPSGTVSSGSGGGVSPQLLHHGGGLPGGSPAAAIISSRSPIGRLRTRKVQWQECEKCARSDHSSDDSVESGVLSPLSGLSSLPVLTTVNASGHRLLVSEVDGNGSSRSASSTSQPKSIIANNISSGHQPLQHTLTEYFGNNNNNAQQTAFDRK